MAATLTALRGSNLARRGSTARTTARVLFAAFVLLATASLTGCVVPNLAPIKGADDVARITVGETSRDEVVALLGSPNVAAADGFLVYNWEKSRAFWVVGGGYSAALGSAGHRGFRAIVELDPDAVVAGVLTARADLQPKRISQEWKRLRGCGLLRLPSAVAVSQDGEQAAALLQNELCLVRPSDPEDVRHIDLGKTSRLAGVYGTFLSFSPDGRLLAVAPASQQLALWDVETGRKIKDLGCTDSSRETRHLPPRPVAFSPDGRRLASLDRGCGLVVWEIEAGVEVLRHSASVIPETIAFSPDGEVIALGGRGGMLEILDADSGAGLMLRDAIPGSPFVTTVAFSPDGRWLAVSTPVHLELWSLATLRESGWTCGRQAILLLPFFKHAPAYNIYDRPVVGFSRDSGTVAVFTHETVSLIDPLSGTTRDLYRFKFPILSVALDPAWTRLVLLTADGLRLWEIPQERKGG